MFGQTIKSYLVSLGFRMDVPSYQAAERSMANMEKTVGKFADFSKVKLAGVGLAVAALAATSTASVAKFTAQVAQADLQNELMARRLWMSTDAAVAYQKSLDALGASLQDLYLSPEVMQRFLALRQQSGQLAPPGDFSQTMRGVRDITFQFQRMRLEASYGLYWIGYWLGKILAGPGAGLRKWLSDLNDSISKNMPTWTKQVAEFLSGFIRLGQAVAWVGRGAIDVWNNLGTDIKQVVGILTGAGAAVLVLSNPVTALIAGMTGLLLLLEDFYVYERGGKSALPGLWKWVDEMKKGLGNNPELKNLLTDLDGLSTQSLILAGSIGTLVGKLKELTGTPWAQGTLKTLFNDMRTWAVWIDNWVKGMTEYLKLLAALSSGDWNKINQVLEEMRTYAKRGLENWRDNLFGPTRPGEPGYVDPKNPLGFLPSHPQGQPQSYMLPPGFGKPLGFSPSMSGAGVSRSITNHFNATFNIYGASDPKAVTTAVETNITGLLMRSLQGVIV